MVGANGGPMAQWAASEDIAKEIGRGGKIKKIEKKSELEVNPNPPPTKLGVLSKN